jgi:uncharacterized protein (TIRG00374 family)
MKKTRKYLAPLLSVLITLIVLWFVGNWLLRDSDIDSVIQILKDITTVSLLVLVISAIFNVWVFQYPYLVTTKNLKYWQAFQVRNTSFAISNAVPAGGTIGLSFQYAMLRSFGTEVKQTNATIGIASVWNGLISFFMPVLGLVALVFAGEITSGLIRSTVLGLLVLIISLLMFYVSLKSAQGSLWVGNLFSKLINPLRVIFKKPKLNLSKSINDFRIEVSDLVKTKWKSISSTNFLVQFSMFLVFWASSAALGIEISVAIIFAIFCFGRLGTTIPLTPGGIGTTDAIMVTMMQLYGIPADLALASVLLWRGFSYIPQVILGLLSFIFWQLSRVK